MTREEVNRRLEEIRKEAEEKIDELYDNLKDEGKVLNCNLHLRWSVTNR